MTKSIFAPWISLQVGPEGHHCISAIGGDEVYTIPLSLPVQILEQLAPTDPVFFWDQWIKACDDVEDILMIKKAWRFFETNQLLLTELSQDLWLSSKDFFLHPVSKAPWGDWAVNLAIVRDKHKGWWLEVPGALSSIWTPHLSRLEHLISAPTEQEKTVLSEYGFDGRYIGTEVLNVSNTQDWLWLESSRRTSWSGPEGRGLPTSLPHLHIPLGHPSSVEGASLHRPPRLSTRGHQSLPPLQVQDLLTVLSSTFKITGQYESSFYGMRSRLHGPSGGGAFESDGWVWATNVDGLAPGLYRFDGISLRLHSFELPAELHSIWSACADRHWGRGFGQPNAIVAVVSDLTLLLKKYQRLAVQVAMLNAGVRLAELVRFAEELDLAVCPIGGGILKDLAASWGGNPNLYTPLAEVALGGRLENNLGEILSDR